MMEIALHTMPHLEGPLKVLNCRTNLFEDPRVVIGTNNGVILNSLLQPPKSGLQEKAEEIPIIP